MITNHFKIAFNYLKFWFWLDFFSVIPISQFLNGSEIFGIDFLATLLKIPRIYKLIKISKLSRTLRFRKRQGTIVARVLKWLGGSDSLMVTIMPLYIMVFAMAHIFSCLWYFQSDNHANPDTWLQRYSFANEQLWDRYCASLYYVYSTLTTTGYGDIVPATNLEYAITIFYMAVGVTFHSFIYTHMLEKFEEVNQKHDFYTSKIEILKLLDRKEKIFKGVVGRKIFRDMIFVIKEHMKRGFHEH